MEHQGTTQTICLTPRTTEAIQNAMHSNPHSMVKSMKECRDAWQFMAARLEDRSRQLERELAAAQAKLKTQEREMLEPNFWDFKLYEY